ncbi:MAG: acetate/propionate family kinase [Pseudomonadota bacterium]
MQILILNAGSSSLKVSIFELTNNQCIFSHNFERISDIKDCFDSLKESFSDRKFTAIGHRVAFGGAKFNAATLINEQVIEDIQTATEIAPLHNPPALAAIAIARQIWGEIPHFAVFDNAFHSTLPQVASTYAVPQNWRNAGVRRYGFHGSSHQYIMEKISAELGKKPEDLRIISCHLGNGASICAIKNGKSIDTSMGMTALEGLLMGTRCGDLDPGIFAYIKRKFGLSLEQIEYELYHNSGLLGLSGISNDLRDIETQAEKGNLQAQITIEVYAYRVRKYIGAYMAVMDGCDILAFTGGIGENSGQMRAKICEGFAYVNLYIDPTKNLSVDLADYAAQQIQTNNSNIKIIVTKTREDFIIAKNIAGKL